MTGLISYFTRHRTAANLLLVILLALGLAAVPQMRAQFFPDVVSDDIDISIAWPGAGAQAVDEGIVSLVEPALQAVEGVAESSARASEGRASLNLEFEPGWDIARAAADVETALDGVSNLPEDAEEPEISWGGWRDRVTDVVITGPIGVEQLGRVADQFIAQLFQRGVTQATISGLAAPETVVEVPSLALVQYDLTLAQIADAIAAESDTAPAGDVGGTARVRAGQASRGADAIGAIVLRSRDDGAPLTVGDVATVRVEGADRARAYFVGDNPAISITVERSARGTHWKFRTWWRTWPPICAPTCRRACRST